MRRIEPRLTKLEQRAKPRGLVVVELFEGETNGQALAIAGVKPDPKDLVIFLRQFRKRPSVSEGIGGPNG